MEFDCMESDMLFDFPFADYSDEELDEKISYSIKELHSRLKERDFEFFEVLGNTLIKLENERDIRKKRKH